MRNKGKKILTSFLLSLILIACLVGCADKKNTLDIPAAPGEPIGLTSENFVSQLTKYCHSGAKFYLKENITIDMDEWAPIGQTVSTAFNGELDGKGYSITGLRTSGWDADGTPVTVLKRILGWKKDGTPVYRSSEVVHMETKTTGDYKEVTDIIFQGEESDPDYIDLAKDGIFEEKTSFGSIGLFGYTYGAKIKNLTIDNADFRFYGDGENVYAGFVSGFDIGSDFTNITVQNSSIYASTIEQTTIHYYAVNAKPEKVTQDNNTKQYIGGIVGYSRGINTDNNGYKTTVFDDITIENIIFDNTNNSAVWDVKLAAVYSQFDEKSESNADYMILKTDLTDEEGFGSYLVDTSSYTVKPVKQAFFGGVSGYSIGATVKDVTVIGINQNSESKKGHTLTADKISAGGVSAALLGAESLVKNVGVKDVELNTQGIKIGALLGGAFGEVKSAVVSENCSVEGKTRLIYVGKNSSGETVCIGGFAAYCDEYAKISGVIVDGSELDGDGNENTIYIQSSYRDKTGNLGSILGGLVGVLRDSSLNNSKAKAVVFNIKDNTGDNDYCFTRNAVGQVYGNSSIKQNVVTVDCKYYKGATVGEYTAIKPFEAKNNYVNENGETSARLYYFVDDEYAGVYVTVYGDLIAIMKDRNYRLREENVYLALTQAQKEEMLANGKIPNNGKYYFFETNNRMWQNIQSTADDTVLEYDENRLYGLSETMYRVELPSTEIGKDFPQGIDFYTFKEDEGRLIKVEGGKIEDRTYYIDYNAANVGRYELDVTVYTESDKIIEAEKAGADNIETTTYIVSLAKFDDNVNIYDEDGKTILYTKCPAEMYLDVYFGLGSGFRTDINGYAVASAQNTNRDYSAYKLVDGRPVIEEGAISYKSVE